MPTKRKRPVAKFSTDNGTTESVADATEVVETPPPARQVVEVLDDESISDDALETIKEDAQEIEETVEQIEEARDEKAQAAEVETMHTERPKEVVEELFSKPRSGIEPEITVVGKRDSSLGVWVGAMLGIALAVGVSLVLLVRGPKSLGSVFVKPTPTPAPTAAPTSTPAPAISREDVKVAVVNGGGVAGAGSKMKEFLEQKGYEVVSVSNADEYTFESTQIQVKSGKDDVASLLSGDLKAEYTLESAAEALEEDAVYDALVTVGKE